MSLHPGRGISVWVLLSLGFLGLGFWVQGLEFNGFRIQGLELSSFRFVMALRSH